MRSIQTLIKDYPLNRRQTVLSIGLILIGAGLVFNEWLLRVLFSVDGVLEPRSVVIIWAFDLTMLLIGLVLALSRSFARLFDLFVGLGITALMIFGAEKLFYRLNHPQPPPGAILAPPAPNVHYEGSYTQDFFRPDDLLGYRPRPEARVTSIKKSDNDSIYEVIYSIDEYQRRVTPVENRNRRTKFLLFFGDSFVFGEGVNDDETFPFYVSQLATGYQPYNYGLSGYGPQQMLAKLQSDELPAEVLEKEGIAIYTFIDAHVERAIGSMYVYNAWGDKMPYYATGRRGKLVRKGNFTTGRPLLSALYGWLEKSEIADYYDVNIPGELKDRHYAFAVRIIAAARDAFRAKFHSDQFYVVIYPDEGDYFEEMEPHFIQAGLKILNYDEALKLDPAQGLAIAGDGHPTAKAHQIVARMIVADLALGDRE